MTLPGPRRPDPGPETAIDSPRDRKRGSLPAPVVTAEVARLRLQHGLSALAYALGLSDSAHRAGLPVVEEYYAEVAMRLIASREGRGSKGRSLEEL